LEEKEPGGWTSNLSHSLFDLVGVLVASERISESESTIDRAIQLKNDYMEHPGKSPLAARELAIELSRIVLQLYSRTYRVEMAESLINEVSEIYDLDDSPSELHEFLQGQALNNIGASSLFLDCLSKTESILENASSLLESYKDRYRVLSRNMFAMSLCNLAIQHKREGQLKKSKELYLQAISIYEEIAHLIPNRFQRNFAVTLSNYSVLLWQMKLISEAEAKISRAIEIEREYVKIEPFLYEPILAISLSNQGILFSVMDRLSDAEESLNEAVQLRRRLAERTQEMHQAGLAVSLHNLGILLMKAGKSKDAEDTLREAAENWELLIVKAPDLFNPRLAKTLHHLRIILLEDESNQKEVKAIQKRLSSMKIELQDDADLWIGEEEPLFIW
jgi:tetratricopeptide (TPR) repeat protein